MLVNMDAGAIVFVCMDWRHMGELLTIGTTAFAEHKIWSYGPRPMAAWVLFTGRSISSSS
ncbi:hypothetical protein SPHINGOR109_30389 [Sphingorhabdus sp. 109]|jgi:hypothetical protein|nr:hypothetical protein SPHINGOR109_30389 [Sphingorhabdus sp. 109]